MLQQLLVLKLLTYVVHTVFLLTWSPAFSVPSGPFDLVDADEWVVQTLWQNRIIKYTLQAF